jgi:hypothetical protein
MMISKGRSEADRDYSSYNYASLHHRIHYYTVKPHMALEGQTSDQAAGIGVEAKNKWMAMLKLAIANNDARVKTQRQGNTDRY